MRRRQPLSLLAAIPAILAGSVIGWGLVIEIIALSLGWW
jgi:hypothetical protein